jgi:DNA ligase-4
VTYGSGLAKAASLSEQKEVGQWFVTNATAQEMKWIVRLVLKKLQIGCSDSTILKHFHPDADALHNSCMSIRRVAEELYDPALRLHVRAVNFGQAMKPMLADKVHLSTLQQDVRDKDIVIETKLDGERLLLHYEKKSSSLFLFSRQGTDYSDEYGKQLKRVVREQCDCSSCVLDGEVLAWNEADQVFEDFGSLKTVAAGDGQDRHLCFVAFDVLMLNGSVVTDQTLRQRRQLLEACVRPRENWFYCVAQLPCSSVDTVKEKLQEACERQEEGIVLKDLNSKYLPGERSSAWSKLKLDCLDNMSHDLDLIVIGASYSKSRGRRGALYVSQPLTNTPLISIDLILSTGTIFCSACASRVPVQLPTASPCPLCGWEAGSASRAETSRVS